MLLVNVLNRCRALCTASEDAMYASTGVSGIVAILDRGILALENDAKPHRGELTLSFAPTGDLQETSMTNGWAKEYLALSAMFDDLIE